MPATRPSNAAPPPLPSPTPTPRAGRRPGRRDTRGEILDAARRAFAAKGFAATTLRSIAAEAGVDAALIHHYFDTKRDLFLATVAIPVPVPDLVAALAAAGTDGLGDRLIRGILAIWESDRQPALVAALRTAFSDPALSRSLREFLTFEVIGRLLRSLHVPAAEAERRGGLVASQLLGVFVGRYALELPGLVHQSPQQLASAIGPTLQRYLTGDFDHATADLLVNDHLRERTPMNTAQPAAAPGWDVERVTRWLAQADSLERQLGPVSDALFDAAALQPGDRVLDVGCGTGPTTAYAAQLVGATGAVTGVDAAAAVIEAARTRQPDRPGSAPVDWLVADVDHHDFPAAAYDVVLSRFGVMFFADPVTAFRRLANACCPGGRLVCAVWMERTRTPFFAVPYDVVIAALDAAGASFAPVPVLSGPTSLGRPEGVTAILGQAGWRDVAIADDFRTLYPGGGGSATDAADSVIELGAVRQVLQDQPPEMVALARDALIADFGPRHDGTGVALPGGFMIVTATREPS